MSDRMATLTAQEVERVTVFAYAETIELEPQDGTIVVIVDPTTGKIVERARDMETALRAIRRHGYIAFAVADLPNWDRLDETAEPYWTIERAQRFYDHHRAHYVNGDEC